MAKAKDDPVSYQDAWRGLHNVVSQFGPHVEALTAALERAATVEKFLADSEAIVEERQGIINSLNNAITNKKVELDRVDAAVTGAVREGEADKRRLQQEIKELNASRERTANELELAKQKAAVEMSQLSSRRSASVGLVEKIERDIEARKADLANLQSRINTARTALGA